MIRTIDELREAARHHNKTPEYIIARIFVLTDVEITLGRLRRSEARDGTIPSYATALFELFFRQVEEGKLNV